MAQDDFHYANAFRGHILGVQTFVFDRADLNTWILLDRPMSQPPGTDYEWRLRIDLTVRF